MTLTQAVIADGDHAIVQRHAPSEEVVGRVLRRHDGADVLPVDLVDPLVDEGGTRVARSRGRV